MDVLVNLTVMLGFIAAQAISTIETVEGNEVFYKGKLVFIR